MLVEGRRDLRFPALLVLVNLLGGVSLLFASAVQAHAAPPSTAAVAKTLTGVWRLDGNSKFTRTFDADGAMTDRYQGDESATLKAKWSLFTSKDRDARLDSVLPGVTYLRVDDGMALTFYAVVKADGHQLHLRYTDRRGSVLNFTRLPRR